MMEMHGNARLGGGEYNGEISKIVEFPLTPTERGVLKPKSAGGIFTAIHRIQTIHRIHGKFY